ncbi:hypothetical protein [Actinomyces minihominis]|uniref:hypothetical protein n=1 Tax=Actinomyces minihominis TaxID=2002838 RepID=UPI001F5DEB59|nr:hypothetical protein [Actinomyces minihominis]
MPQRYEAQDDFPLDVTPEAQLEVGSTERVEEYVDDSGYGPSTVIAALDQIEILVQSARAVPLSANIVLNKAEILDLVNQSRDALPDDLVAADAVVADADAVLGRADDVAEAAMAEASMRARTLLEDARAKSDTILAEAADEAERKVARATEEATNVKSRAAAEVEAMLADAHAQVDRLISSDHVTELAGQRARELVTAAKRESSQLRQGAEDYVSHSLGQTADLLKDLLRRTEAGMRALSNRDGVDEAANIDLD